MPIAITSHKHQIQLPVSRSVRWTFDVDHVTMVETRISIDRNICSHSRKIQCDRTRRHEVTLVKDQCRLDLRKYSFSQRTINEWNTLSTDCVTASSVNMFKNKVNTYMKRVDYTITLSLFRQLLQPSWCQTSCFAFLWIPSVRPREGS